MGSDWRQTTLGDICEKIQTGPFGSQLHKSDYVAEGIPSIMPVNIRDNRITTDGIARISEEDAERLSRYLVKSGDVVYSRRGRRLNAEHLSEIEKMGGCVVLVALWLVLIAI